MKKNSLLIAALLIAAGSLQAATLEQTHEIATHGPGSTLDPWTDTWSFDKFDDQGGSLTLNSVRVIFSIQAWGGYIGSDNDGGTTANGSISLDVNGHLASSDVTLLNSSFQTAWSTLLVRELDTLSLASNDGDGAGYQTGGADWNLLTGPIEANANSASADGYIADAVESSYIGADTFSLTFTSTQVQNLLSGGNVESIISPQTAKGSVSVIYDYTAPIPEPASASLAILVLVTGFWVRRRFVD
jgi:hypothetical protein